MLHISYEVKADLERERERNVGNVYMYKPYNTQLRTIVMI